MDASLVEIHTIDDLKRVLTHPTEYESVEFKEAKNQFDKKHDLPDYCAAISNGYGGVLLLGVKNSGKVVGSSAFKGNVNRLSGELFRSLGIHIVVRELAHEDGRVVAFNIPKHDVGKLIHSSGHYSYPIRRGEELAEMDSGMMRKILGEAIADFTAQPIEGVGLESVDGQAMAKLKSLRAEKARRPDYLDIPDDQMLKDLGLQLRIIT